jgi:hypothetical protein
MSWPSLRLDPAVDLLHALVVGIVVGIVGHECFVEHAQIERRSASLIVAPGSEARPLPVGGRLRAIMPALKPYTLPS